MGKITGGAGITSRTTATLRKKATPPSTFNSVLKTGRKRTSVNRRSTVTTAAKKFKVKVQLPSSIGVQTRSKTGTLVKQKLTATTTKTFELAIPSKSYSVQKTVSHEAALILRRIDYLFQCMDPAIDSNFTADKLKSSAGDYQNILDYVINSQTHNFGVKIVSILKITRPSEAENCNPTLANPSCNLKMMLFHGTQRARILPILENGFTLPTASGQMYGQGIYFADRVSKSAQYCYMWGQRPDPGTLGYLFICEVQLGRVFNARGSMQQLSGPPSIDIFDGDEIQFDSVKGVGKKIPNRSTQRIQGDVIWPLGPTVDNDELSTYPVIYNEFVVYDPKQIKIRYVIEVKFTEEPCYDYS